MSDNIKEVPGLDTLTQIVLGTVVRPPLPTTTTTTTTIMNISSLLCADDAPQQPTKPSRPSPPPPEPVILAPHLRGHHYSPGPSDDHLPLSLQPHLRKRSFSPVDRDPDPPPRSSHSIANYAYPQRSAYTQQRPPSESYGERPSSSHSHSRSPTLPLFPSTQPSSLSRITSYSPPFAREPSPSQRSPLTSFYPRPPLSQRPTSAHQSQLHSTTPYTFPPVQVQPRPNPISAPHSQPSPKQQTPYMGLEALVQAATQEQRRLSGGRPEICIDDRRLSNPSDRGHPSPVSPRRQDDRRVMRYQHEGGADAREFDHPRRGTGTLVPVEVLQSKPPLKRQRLSDPLSAPEERERNFAAYYVQPPLPMRLSGPGAHAYPVNDKAILGIGTGSSESSQQEEDLLLSTSGSAGKSHRDADPDGKKTSSRPHTPRDTDTARKETKEHVKEQDAHEWLLEHYAEGTPSPSTSTVPPSMARVRGGRPTSASRRTHSRTPAPEIATALEQELEDVGKHEPDTDPDIVLELVAESLDAEDRPKSRRVSMEVDDELLSLVNDPVPAPALAPTQRYPYAAPPPSLRLSKPLTPTIVTVSSPSFVSPAPASPFQPVPMSERGSMPPPATTHIIPKGKAESSAAKGKKTPRPAAKSKQAARPRAKAATKAKAKPPPDNTSPAPATATTSRSSKASPMTASAIKKSSAAARSRSTSTMAGGSAALEADCKVEGVKDPDQENDEAEEKEEDKLYCVCKTRYDEDRVMIACDRCDEWYHTQCVNMPDLEVDLVDQFICPPCIERNSHLNLQTTYKKRCFRGLNHANPSSPEACHKAARGDYSKYCSEKCGTEHLRGTINVWEENGGNKNKLWDRVKHAEKREGVTVCVAEVKMDADCKNDGKLVTSKPRVERDVERLNAQLDEVMQKREKLKKEMDLAVWRARLVELATERSEKVDECAWDQRLCFGEEEYAEFGMEVLAAYEENAEKDDVKDEGEDAMQVDSAGAEEGEWLCRGKKKCERHAGWQKLRAAEVSFEKEMKESVLLKLTTREREIRKRIEDLLDPQARNLPHSTPLKSANGKQINGHAKTNSNGDIIRKGKKKRN